MSASRLTENDAVEAAHSAAIQRLYAVLDEPGTTDGTGRFREGLRLARATRKIALDVIAEEEK